MLSPIVQSGEGALQKISRISSDEYRQRLFQIIQTECHITETNDDMIDFYSIMIRMDPGQSLPSSQRLRLAKNLSRWQQSNDCSATASQLDSDHWRCLWNDRFPTRTFTCVSFIEIQSESTTQMWSYASGQRGKSMIVFVSTSSIFGRFSRRTMSISRTCSSSISSMSRKRNSFDGSWKVWPTRVKKIFSRRFARPTRPWWIFPCQKHL